MEDFYLLKQLATVNGLLAGLSLNSALRLMTSEIIVPTKSGVLVQASIIQDFPPTTSIKKLTKALRNNLKQYTITTFLITSLVLLTAAVFAVIIIDFERTISLPKSIKILYKAFVFLSLFGQTGFLGGVVLVSQIRNEKIGKIVSYLGGFFILLIVTLWIVLPKP